MKTGVQKVKKNHKDFSYHRTFGAISPATFPDSFSCDAGFPVEDQDALGLPFGCTGFSTKNLGQDEDKRTYVAKYTYDQTLAMEGIFEGSATYEKVGCDVRDSLKSSIVYGLQAVWETPTEALNHRRGAYFNVEQVTGFDMFDSIRSALQLNNRSVSLATPWYNSFAVPQNGIITAPGSYDTTFASWHNHVVSGWTTINGIPYLIDKSWQGTEYGVNGFVYFPREVINQLLSISGSGAFTVAPFTGQNIQTVQLTLYETLISYLRQIVTLLS